MRKNLKSTIWCFPLAVVVILAAGCATADAPAQPQAKAKETADQSWTETVAAPAESLATAGRNRYFILEPGYQLVLEGKEGGQTVNLTITVLDETKEVAGVQTRVVEERESTGGKLLEVSRNYCAFGAQSRNVYYFGEDLDEYEGDKVVHGGAWLAGAKGAQSGILMPGEIQVRLCEEITDK